MNLNRKNMNEGHPSKSRSRDDDAAKITASDHSGAPARELGQCQRRHSSSTPKKPLSSCLRVSSRSRGRGLASGSGSGSMRSIAQIPGDSDSVGNRDKYQEESAQDLLRTLLSLKLNLNLGSEVQASASEGLSNTNPTSNIKPLPTSLPSPSPSPAPALAFQYKPLRKQKNKQKQSDAPTSSLSSYSGSSSLSSIDDQRSSSDKRYQGDGVKSPPPPTSTSAPTLDLPSNRSRQASSNPKLNPNNNNPNLDVSGLSQTQRTYSMVSTGSTVDMRRRGILKTSGRSNSQPRGLGLSEDVKNDYFRQLMVMTPTETNRVGDQSKAQAKDTVTETFKPRPDLLAATSADISSQSQTQSSNDQAPVPQPQLTSNLASTESIRSWMRRKQDSASKRTQKQPRNQSWSACSSPSNNSDIASVNEKRANPLFHQFLATSRRVSSGNATDTSEAATAGCLLVDWGDVPHESDATSDERSVEEEEKVVKSIEKKNHDDDDDCQQHQLRQWQQHMIQANKAREKMEMEMEERNKSSSPKKKKSTKCILADILPPKAVKAKVKKDCDVTVISIGNDSKAALRRISDITTDGLDDDDFEEDCFGM